MTGKVYLVGAGPGDYKLLTLKGKECLEEADVIIYDRLANEDYLRLGKVGCEYINVGKASSNHTMPQDEMNELLAKKAQEGKVVARLKGGDPYVFGRGGEEGEYLFERGIPFEVVPGITSAIGGLCYAGIPITHRECASSFHVITGHLKEDSKDEINWEALASLKGTLVFLMGISNLKKITENLLRAGKAKETPVGLVSWATRYNQSVVTGTLEDIYEKALSGGVKPPTLIVIGEVVNLREKLNFFEEKPLFGKQVVVTRTRKQSSKLVEMIRDLGGKALEFPTIDIEPIKDNENLKDALTRLKMYTYLVFTSPNAIEIFFKALEERGKDARALAHLKIAVIGEATRKALKEQGIRADIMPIKAVAETLAECLKQELTEKDYVLLPNSAIARDCLSKSLSERCRVDEVPIYDTHVVKNVDENNKVERIDSHDSRYSHDSRCSHDSQDIQDDQDSQGSQDSQSSQDSQKVPLYELSSKELIDKLSKGEIDYITFTSSSTVHHFVKRIGEEHLVSLASTKLISIGEVTSKTLKEYGLTIYKEAEKATMADLINCMYAE